MKNRLEEESLAYYRLLAEKYPNRRLALSKAIQLSASLKLPKPTEHFLSDLHGEYHSFMHVLRNASGVIRRYINELFPYKSKKEGDLLATIVYYPEEKLAQLKDNLPPEDYQNLLEDTLTHLILLAKRVAAKYDHRKISHFLPEESKEVLESLLLQDKDLRHKGPYVIEMIQEILAMGQAPAYIIDLSNLCTRFAVENLHIIGDIYDRGEEAERIMDFLENHPQVDIQWGNHDIAWIGAAAGSFALIANVLRIAIRYNQLDTIEDGYGINLIPFISYALNNYDESPAFAPKIQDPDPGRNSLLTKMHKAISVLQFKAEGQVILRNPDFDLDHMLLLDKINFKRGTINYLGKNYRMKDSKLPTVDPKAPYAFTNEEKEVVNRLVKSFTTSHRLKRHISFLINSGNMYKVVNDNLLFHGCIPMEEGGTFRQTHFTGEELEGQALLDRLDSLVREAYFQKEAYLKRRGQDICFYLWCGKDSPLFGKDQITTFARYFIAEPKTHVENKDPYYELRKDPEAAQYILKEFGLDHPWSKIINGHTPVKKIKGESPIKAQGQVVVIDGGFAPAYRKTTGTAGYTLISNSYGLLLASHAPMPGEEEMIQNNLDITSSLEYVLEYDERRLAEDTDRGQEKMEMVAQLKKLASLYEEGLIGERF